MSRGGFTLVEVMVSVAASAVVLAALMDSSLSLQKALHGSETYAGAYSNQHRLIDYIGRDLRRSVSVLATDATGTQYPLADNTVTIADRATLIILLPGYYQSNVKADTTYAQALDVVSSDERLDYGDSTGLAPTVEVDLRKVYVAKEGCTCFVRSEAGTEETIVRQADDLYVQVTLRDHGQSGDIKAWFRAAYSGNPPLVTSWDSLLLRNPPLDLHP